MLNAIAPSMGMWKDEYLEVQIPPPKFGVPDRFPPGLAIQKAIKESREGTNPNRNRRLPKFVEMPNCDLPGCEDVCIHNFTHNFKVDSPTINVNLAPARVIPMFDKVLHNHVNEHQDMLVRAAFAEFHHNKFVQKCYVEHDLLTEKWTMLQRDQMVGRKHLNKHLEDTDKEAYDEAQISLWKEWCTIYQEELDQLEEEDKEVDEVWPKKWKVVSPFHVWPWGREDNDYDVWTLEVADRQLVLSGLPLEEQGLMRKECENPLEPYDPYLSDGPEYGIKYDEAKEKCDIAWFSHEIRLTYRRILRLERWGSFLMTEWEWACKEMTHCLMTSYQKDLHSHHKFNIQRPHGQQKMHCRLIEQQVNDLYREIDLFGGMEKFQLREIIKGHPEDPPVPGSPKNFPKTFRAESLEDDIPPGTAIFGDYYPIHPLKDGDTQYFLNKMNPLPDRPPLRPGKDITLTFLKDDICPNAYSKHKTIPKPGEENKPSKTEAEKEAEQKQVDQEVIIAAQEHFDRSYTHSEAVVILPGIVMPGIKLDHQFGIITFLNTIDIANADVMLETFKSVIKGRKAYLEQRKKQHKIAEQEAAFKRERAAERAQLLNDQKKVNDPDWIPTSEKEAVDSNQPGALGRYYESIGLRRNGTPYTQSISRYSMEYMYGGATHLMPPLCKIVDIANGPPGPPRPKYVDPELKSRYLPESQYVPEIPKWRGRTFINLE